MKGKVQYWSSLNDQVRPLIDKRIDVCDDSSEIYVDSTNNFLVNFRKVIFVHWFKPFQERLVDPRTFSTL